MKFIDFLAALALSILTGALACAVYFIFVLPALVSVPS